jgi:uncharacterized membrane protein
MVRQGRWHFAGMTGNLLFMAIPADTSSRPSRTWHHHPNVRSGSELTLGERAADHLRNGMGSWPFVFGALVFLGIWMAGNSNRGFDKYPFILLNLLLSCLAAMQGAILLIAAKRSDQVASELAEHDYEQDCRSEQMLEKLTTEFDLLRRQNADLQQQLGAVMTALDRTPPGEAANGRNAAPGEA